MKRLMFATLLFTGLGAFATSAQQVPVSASPESEATQAADKDSMDDRYCLRSTGSRIVAKQNEKGARRCVAANGRVYTREDLDRTGQLDMADALRRLDPSIH